MAKSKTDQSEQYVSGEQHRARQSTFSTAPKGLTISKHNLMLVIGAVILCALSFAAGTAYQKGHTKTVANTSASSRNLSRGAGGFGRRAGGLGQVTAVSATSITISNQRTGTDSTYTINSSTAISDNGQTVSASDIQSGDTVLITTSGSGSTTATRILVNPSFGGGGFGGSSQPSTNTQTQSD